MVVGIVGGIILQILLTMDQFKLTGYVTPWNLTGYGTSLATGASLAADQFWPWPVLATAIWVVLFVVVALVRFDNTEL
jgi:hypothetical protein